MNNTNSNNSGTVEEQLLTGIISIGINTLLMVITVFVKYVENNKLNKFLKEVNTKHNDIIEKLSVPNVSERSSMGPNDPYIPDTPQNNGEHVIKIDTNRNLVIRKNLI